MSLFWRKAFTWSEGGVLPVLHTFYAMMKRISTKLAYLCGCCPCHKWYIAALCPCGSCVSATPCFLGEPVLVGEKQVTADYGSETYDLVALDIVVEETTPELDASSFTEFPVDCLDTSIGCILWAIRHQTRVAPSYAGTVEASVYVDGVEVADWSDSYTPSERLYIGDGTMGESIASNTMGVDHVFDAGGVHNLDVMVRFIGAGSEPMVAYTMRRSIQIHVPPEDVEWMGAPFVAPDYAFEVEESGACRYIGRISPWDYDINMQIVELKGPFDTQEEAAWVLNHWEAFITAYSQTCLCTGGCEAEFFGPHHLAEEQVGGGYKIEEAGGVDDGADTVYCETGWMEFEGHTSADTEFRLYTPDGTLVFTFKSELLPPDTYLLVGFVVPPCWKVEMYYTSNPEFLDEGELPTLIDGEFWPLGFHSLFGGSSSNDPCILTDAESIYYGDEWDYIPRCAGGPDGVPNNTEELKDHLGTALMECEGARLLREMPEALA